jgi:hypothetical protein
VPVTFADVSDAILASGLTPRGGFHPDATDGVPGNPGTLVLVGNAGPAMWATFSGERPNYADRSNPLDDWVRDRLISLAGQVGATPLFPFGGPPFLPFQRWAQRAEPVHPSPLGLLIHPDHGLWHAYRGALAFAARLALPPPDTRPSPCDSCADKPCLSTCPVGAFGSEGYDVPACAGHLRTSDGQDCIDLGCRARRACPVGVAACYAPDQAEFHMQAFGRAQSAI